MAQINIISNVDLYQLFSLVYIYLLLVIIDRSLLTESNYRRNCLITDKMTSGIIYLRKSLGKQISKDIRKFISSEIYIPKMSPTAKDMHNVLKPSQSVYLNGRKYLCVYVRG